MSAPTYLLVPFVTAVGKINVDYTPNWGRGSPSSYIDNVKFPRVLTDRQYKYRVVKGSTDLGVRDAYAIESDGSQKINFLEYNSGRGIEDSTAIKIYIVEPDTGNQSLLVQWK
ncbi:hypothetical protein S40285_08095 [Stachybotrys chlorohalonatus IBT 40285]|uniref:Immunomodulatory protein Ling Zhi-8 n=2 Tax=Stachybotrys chlorohalonatus TaxID=388913 RepID=A0A084QD05_STAC4|nr:immunomodulatory protein [Stachybotrys chlorohalonata]KFA61840.1 hypothetical protein S40285_08095 [Stachybotrys chlorohalonata IBT 40285]